MGTKSALLLRSALRPMVSSLLVLALSLLLSKSCSMVSFCGGEVVCVIAVVSSEVVVVSVELSVSSVCSQHIFVHCLY